MVKRIAAVGVLVLLGSIAEAQTLAEATAIYEANLAEIARQEEAVYQQADAVMELAMQIAEQDPDPRCSPVVSYGAALVATRSGLTNLYADAVSAYCTAAEFYVWLSGHFEGWREEMRWLGVALQIQQDWYYNGFWWRYWV
jgi:hypothetical protein